MSADAWLTLAILVGLFATRNGPSGGILSLQSLCPAKSARLVWTRATGLNHIGSGKGR